MKKNFTLKSVLMLIAAFALAMPAWADVTSAANLYGNYKFSAEMEITNAGQAYASKFSNDCEVSIEKDPYNYGYYGVVKGIAGLSGLQFINEFSKDDHTITIYSPNSQMGAEGLYMSDITGSKGIFTGNENQYGDVIYTFDPETKEFILPDFSLVTLGENRTAGDIVAKFTNVKLTPIESEKPEIAAQWEGTYKVSSTISMAPVQIEGYEYPTTFEMVVEYDEATQKYSVTEFLGVNVKELNYGAGLEFTPSADEPNKAQIATGGCVQMVVRGDKYLYLKDSNFSDAPLTIILQEDGTYTISDFSLSYTSYVSGEQNKFAAWYQNVTATKIVDEDMDTNVKNIIWDHVVEGIFDLTGRKLEAITTPGLYIVNGKKVVVK